MLELASVIILGILAQWVAWKFKIPAILPLILIGLFVGPVSTLLSEDGTKWIEPVWNGEEGFFPGDNLFYFVSLAISVILFEGGLTLRKNEIRNVGPGNHQTNYYRNSDHLFRGRHSYTLYFWIKLENFFSVFSANHCYGAYSNFADPKEYPFEKGCVSRIEVGRYPNRSYWGFGGRIGF